MSYTNGLDNPQLYFQTKLYTGNGGTQSITLDGSEDMQVDWCWIICRSAVEGHVLFDSVRGVQKAINSNTTSTEATSSNYLTAFGTDGFSVGSSGLVNANSETYVSWNWKAGGSGSSNSNGSITSSVSASTDAGFSIVSYTGTGSNATVGHGLGVAPKMMIFKNRSASQPWCVYHDGLSSSSYSLHLDETSAEQNLSPNPFNSSAPTSTLINLGGQDMVNKSSDNHIAYCFAEKKGYSKFGSYTGNDNANGTFVYTGFAPAWVMIKRTNSVNDWIILDTKRNPINPSNERLLANTNGAASTANTMVDFLSNGFKPRSTYGGINGASDNFIYMAFAESPFVNSAGAVPNNAR